MLPFHLTNILTINHQVHDHNKCAIELEHDSMELKIELTTMLGVIPNLQISQENGKIMITHFLILIALHLHLMPLHEKLSSLA